MSAWSLPLLPTNGLDRSLHAPVLVGLLLVTFFTEAFGWTYAGLVVPGYLAATFAAAPITAVLVLLEGWLTHVGVATIARIIPERTGAWSTAFGRERFFLYIVVAIVIRLFVEGTVVPWFTVQHGLSHSRELYSIGLVLVPLVANVFWSSGFIHAGPRLLILTGLTYLVVDQVLLKHTNFSLSRFQVANESVALHFLDTPKAYLLLLVGAMLGARGNVQYGWDYNGILVPALLAVAWYEPLKLVGTAAEAVSLYLLARFLAGVRPFSRLALVGPRRMVFVGMLGFVVKLGLGHALMRSFPKVQLTEYLGFGYILPSLLAVKMWNKLRIGVVLMPTLQVSLSAFLVGNALGFGLNWLTSPRLRQATAPQVPTSTDSLSLAWILSSHISPHRRGECQNATDPEVVAAIVASTLRRGFPIASELARLEVHELEMVTDHQLWWLIVPKTDHPERCTQIRVALAPDHLHKAGALTMLLDAKAFGSPTVVSALALAEATLAPIVIVYDRSSDESHRLAQRVSQAIPNFSVLELAGHAGTTNRLSVAGSLPPSIDIGRMERQLQGAIELSFVSSQTLRHPTLSLTHVADERAASRYLGTARLETWPGPMRRSLQSRLTEMIGQSYRAPTRTELLLLSAAVLPALESTKVPSDWTLALAQRLGYSIAQADEGDKLAWILFEPPGSARRGNATWLTYPKAARNLTVEVPAPLWELGTLSYGISLFSLLDARHLLIAGARPDARDGGAADPRRAAGRLSYFQHLHEFGLANGGDSIAIHAIRPDVPIAEDVIAESTAPILSSTQRSTLANEVLDVLARAGLRTGQYSATLTQVSIGAQFDPAFAFAERFAPDRMLRLWFGQGAREQIARIPPTLTAFNRIVDRSPLECDLAVLAMDRLLAQASAPSTKLATSACPLDEVVSSMELWLEQNNPFDRIDAKRIGRACTFYAAVDAPTGMPWLVLIAQHEGRFVPLHSPNAVKHRVDAGSSPVAWRKALDLGTATIRFEAP